MAALVFGALVHRIVVRETGDRAAARRAAWLTQLAPGAYALVLGYTEPLAGVLAAAYFLTVRGYADRGPRWWTAVALGFLSGMARPTGLLLAIPGAVEGLRAARAFHHVWRIHVYGHQVALMAVLLILLVAALLPLLARRLPVSYLAWTLPMYALAITSHDFTSLPRYLGALFPVLIAAALVCRRRWQEVALVAASGALLLWTTHTVLVG